MKRILYRLRRSPWTTRWVDHRQHHTHHHVHEKPMKSKTVALVMSGLIFNAAAFDAQAVEVRGTPTCSGWIKQKGTLQGSGNKGWLVGFLSGVAVEGDKDFLLGTESDALFLWVDNYCQANPLNDVALAGWALSVELRLKKDLLK